MIQLIMPFIPWVRAYGHTQYVREGATADRVGHTAIAVLYTTLPVMAAYLVGSSLGFSIICLSALAVLTAADLNWEKVEMLYHDVISGMPRTLYGKGFAWPPIKIRDDGTCFFRALAVAVTIERARLRGIKHENEIGNQEGVNRAEQQLRQKVAQWLRDNIKPGNEQLWNAFKSYRGRETVESVAGRIERGDATCWGTEVEAIAVSNIYKKQICICSNNTPLQSFGASGERIGLYFTASRGALNENHYELLLDNRMRA